jgi:hypothetical protein
MSLAAQAIAAALRDAKLAPRDVDGVVRFDRDALGEYDLPGVCGITNLGFYNAVPSGPGGAPALLRMAAMAITQGLASVVLCHHARDGVARPTPPPAAEAAWLARLQRGERGRRRAYDARASPGGVANPSALARRPLTAADRMKSPYVAEPIRRVDLAAPAGGRMRVRRDGGGARTPPRTPHPGIDAGRAPVAGAASVGLAGRVGARPDRTRCQGDVRRGARTAGRRRRGVRERRCEPARADRGEALSRHDGTVNPHGGQLCEAALDGVNDVAEAVRQMRGDAATPVRGARVALVTGSLLEPTSAVLLGRPS